MDTTASDAWFAAVVNPHHEKAVAQVMRYKEMESFLPLYPSRQAWSDRIKTVLLPLFPGYVFCRFRSGNWMPVLSMPGVRYLVSLNGRPVPIPDEEIAQIHAVLSSGLTVQPWPFLKAGQKVRIESGCFDGFEGVLMQDEEKWRVVVGIEFLCRSVAVEIDRTVVRAVVAGRA